MGASAVRSEFRLRGRTEPKVRFRIQIKYLVNRTKSDFDTTTAKVSKFKKELKWMCGHRWFLQTERHGRKATRCLWATRMESTAADCPTSTSEVLRRPVTVCLWNLKSVMINAKYAQVSHETWWKCSFAGTQTWREIIYVSTSASHLPSYPAASLSSNILHVTLVKMSLAYDFHTGIRSIVLHVKLVQKNDHKKY